MFHGIVVMYSMSILGLLRARLQIGLRKGSLAIARERQETWFPLSHFGNCCGGVCKTGRSACKERDKMEIPAIVLLLAGVFSTVACITTEDLVLLLPTGLFYLCCGIILASLSKEKGGT